ncbi:MAG: tetratricopeptide repeat protein, partial [Verrucomicrobia bacterium]|nr:tetratricopeptide repeat protein [Verrucomicrobiota bacterium]
EKLSDLESQIKRSDAIRKELDHSLQAIKEEQARPEAELKKQLQQAEDQVRALKRQNDELSRGTAQKTTRPAGANLPDAKPISPQAGRNIDTTTQASEDTNVLAAEQRIIAEARSRDKQFAKQETESAPESQNAKQKDMIEADRHYKAGIQKWDAQDIDGAITEFKKTIYLNPDAAGAYYNLGLAYLHKDDISTACNYAYQAGHTYIKRKNTQQALRMMIFIKSMDSSSRLIDKLRKEIYK